MYELETKRREMKQKELIKELTAAAEEANKIAIDFETQVNNIKANVKALGEADKENTELKAEAGIEEEHAEEIVPGEAREAQTQQTQETPPTGQGQPSQQQQQQQQ
ncbi:uncharacterized protein LOC110696425 [Chenopodium quinoa]|uniref:uncharacterized protein LOC110696425 n=1 Tax=Chenopodium quinoa TaxID=63459 RepID=UPI000B791A5C|nr:uncharacterized protein LOC110696425 [Chenopodium quinoa]